jgi:hypothetical protein
MSIYYIEDNNGVIYQLDATIEISYQESGIITNNIIETGESVADHYINQPVIFNLRGSISDVKSLSSSGSNAKSTEDYINGLRKLKTNKETFTFHFGEKVGSFSNCLFENLTVSQNQSRGNRGAVDSFEISASIKQVRIAQRARLTTVRQAGPVSDNYQDQVKGTSTTEQPEDEDTYLLGARLSQEGIAELGQLAQETSGN